MSEILISSWFVSYVSAHWEISQHVWSFLAFLSPHMLEYFTSQLNFIYTHPSGKEPLGNTLINMSGDWMSVTFNLSQSDFKKELWQAERRHESGVRAVISLWFCQMWPLCCHFAVSLDVSMSDIKPRPSRCLKQRETEVRGCCFKFCCSALLSRLKRFSSRPPPSCLTCLPFFLTSLFAACCALISAASFLSSLLQHCVTPLLFSSSSNFDQTLCTLRFGSTAEFWPRLTLTASRPFSYLTFETFDHTYLSWVWLPTSCQP